MAQSNAIVWEVRTVGSATNGGGFKAGASGTDWSQQTAAQYSVTDAVTAGTTTVTSATAAFGTDVVGNVAYIQGGTGSVVAGWYEITARADASTITVDRSTGLTAGTGATLKIGGALNSLNTLVSAWGTGGQAAFVKADGTYTQTASPQFNGLSVTPANGATFNRLIGYTTTRGDGGRASISLSTNSGLIAIYITSFGWIIENFDINCNNLTTSSGISHAGNGNGYYINVRNCKVSNLTSQGIRPGVQSGMVIDCEATGGGSGATAGIFVEGGAIHVMRCWSHNNACPGIYSGGSAPIIDNLVTNNTGATVDGIIVTNYGIMMLNNTVYGSGRHGIHVSNTFQMATSIRNNILVNNGASGTGYGIKFNSTGAIPAYAWNDGNIFYNNATGTRDNGDLATGIAGVGAYTNVYDVSLQGSPFVNPTANNFELNNLPGRGLACKKLLRGAMPGTTTYNYVDAGSLRPNLERNPLTKNRKGY